MRTLFAALITSLALLGTAPAATADESPGIDDHATLLGGRVVHHGGGARLDLRLTCPKGDRYQAHITIVLASDAVASGSRSGTCQGRKQQITVRLAAQEGPPLTPGCDAEYGVTITGRTFSIAFDRGGADGGPDGPGPVLCLTGRG
jgi:hypothetical protein